MRRGHQNFFAFPAFFGGQGLDRRKGTQGAQGMKADQKRAMLPFALHAFLCGQSLLRQLGEMVRLARHGGFFARDARLRKRSLSDAAPAKSRRRLPMRTGVAFLRAGHVRPRRRHGEMADARDLKSLGRQLPCGFESRCRQPFHPSARAENGARNFSAKPLAMRGESCKRPRLL